MANETLEYYSTPEEVIQSSGIRPDDLGFKTAEDMEAWIVARLKEVKDLIDRDRNRDFAAEAAGAGGEVPAGIHGIALRMCCNHIDHANRRRTTPIVRVDDFTISVTDEQLLTEKLKKDLRRYPAKIDGFYRRLGMVVVSKNDTD